MAEKTHAFIGKIFDHFRVKSYLGAGGMGEVYFADDLHLGRPVAIKFLARESISDATARKRFILEARVVSGLEHPNICAIHAFGETGDDQLFIVMPYYRGETLKERLLRGVVPFGGACDIALQIGRGLHAAHQAGITHRDIKPANIMLTQDGYVKILDFGIAKLKGQPITRTAATLGTVAYMSPEQAMGLEVDRRSDLWSLGVVLFEMLTGKLPFRGKADHAMLYAIVNEQPLALSPAITNQNAGIAECIAAALAKEPAARFSDAAEFCRSLQAVRGPSTTTGDDFPSTMEPLLLEAVREDHAVEPARNDRLSLFSRIGFGALGAYALALAASALGGLSNAWSAALAGITFAAIALFIGRGGWQLRRSMPARRPFLRSFLNTAFIFSLALVGALVSTFALQKAGPPPSNGLRHHPFIAVLPFENKTADRNLDWLANAIADMLISDIGESRHLRVLQHAALPGLLKSPGSRAGVGRQAADSLNLRFLVSGSVARVAEQVSIMAMLEDVLTGEIIKSVHESGSELSMGMLQRLMGKVRIALEMQVTGRTDIEEALAHIQTNSLEAFKAYMRAQELNEVGEYGEAARQLNEAIRIDPHFASAYSLLAHAYDGLGERVLARGVMNRALELAEGLPRVEKLSILVRQTQLTSDLDAKFRYIQELAALQPYNAYWHYLLAFNYAYHSRDYPKSLRAYAKALELDPISRPGIYFHRGYAEFGANQPADAIASFQKYVEIRPQAADAHNRMAEAYMLVGAYQQAEAELRLAASLDSSAMLNIKLSGDLSARLGRDNLALQKYRTGVAKAKSQSELVAAEHALALFYLHQDRIADARQAIAVALRQAPRFYPVSHVEVLWVHGLTALRDGDEAAAAAALSDMSTFFSDMGTLRLKELHHHLRGKYLRARGKDAEAIREFEAAVALGPLDRALFLYALAQAQAAVADYAAARESLAALLAFNPNYARAFVLLGQIHERLGQRAPAVVAYERALHLWRGADSHHRSRNFAQTRLAALQTGD